MLIFDKVMNIWNWWVAPADIDFGWEPRALAPDLKMLPQKFQIEKNSTVGDSSDRESDSLHVSPAVEFFSSITFFFLSRCEFSTENPSNQFSQGYSIGSILERSAG